MGKIVIGHKVLNLEELTMVAYLGRDLAEVVVDSQLYAELATQPAQKSAEPQFRPLFDDAGDQVPLKLTREQVRAALLAKLVQLLKLKKNAQKTTVDFLTSVLNATPESSDLAIPSVSPTTLLTRPILADCARGSPCVGRC